LSYIIIPIKDICPFPITLIYFLLASRGLFADPGAQLYHFVGV